ncbi:N-acetylglucosamine repressor [Nonomuraea coxensis DSM 45129]|uniref:N-acetylglucosamine repressor n=1 Tax=Nonomuraea coxensis DSM 45129 TaxID=1122611 RepID=A0ABX8TXD9_9ACTN|nr:ROK family transcriptional regulator [Nonomuraea coxensis]QYC39965.1 N-acetylglucosamine repressor [Nonomuraea coxensis DSM 45129]
MSPPRGPLSQLRRGHEELVLGLLRKHGPLSRGELGKLCRLSRTTLYDILAELVATGAVVPAGQQDDGPRGRGRPAETLALNPGAGQAIGIDFARRALHVAAVNLAHEIVGAASEPHDADLPWERRVDLAERLVGRLGGGDLRLGALSAIGAGVVGPVSDLDSSTGEAGDPLPHRAQVLLRERFGVPVLLDNNTRLAALGEAIWGAATGARDVLYLRLSHSVNGGLVIDGSLHRGAYGLSGEFGHIVVDPGGRPCSCGGAGCLETVASVRAVLDAYRERGGHADDVRGLAEAAGKSEPAALALLAEVGADIGAVLAALCNAVGPGVIVIGGELAETGAALLEPIRRTLDARIMPISRRRVSLRAATLGEAAGALGGIALVLHESPLLSRYPAGPDLAAGVPPLVAGPPRRHDDFVKENS